MSHAQALFVVVLLFSIAANAQTPNEEIAEQVPAALKILRAYHDNEPVPLKRSLQIVYWTPADREPAPQYRERLTRVFTDIRDFYLKEMKRLGLSERPLPLVMEADGMLKIHLVKGAHPYEKYNVKSGEAIRKECLPILSAAGLNAEHETLVIFCNMSNWNPELKTMSQNSPYYASGGMRHGTAWQVDSPLLDSALLPNKEPMLQDGQYGLISVGKYNSIFVGGVCHEIGHALGLPHNLERPDQRALFGTALMGSGNRTYGDDRRGEGRGSFLTLAEGLRLAAHPFFSGSDRGLDLPRKAKIEIISVDVSNDAKSFTFTGTVNANTPVYALIGYLDPDGGSDYDATTATAIPDSEGKFILNCKALKPDSSGVLRISACQVHGGYHFDKAIEFPAYTVSQDGTVKIIGTPAPKHRPR